MKLKITLAISFLFVAISFMAFKMEDPFTELLKKLDEYTNKYPQEKVHLHMDKPYYAIGDDIWFKAYVVNTKTQAPSLISKVLYVELINEKDSVKKQVKLPLMGGVTWGDFKLTDSLGEGNYRVRAYTRYMRNFGTDFFFDKTIKVGNSWANKVFTNTQYSFVKENNTDKVNATIHFEDKNGVAYKENEVNYDVQLDYRSVAKGKTKTNLSGDAQISFANAQMASNKTGKIVATITLDNKQKVVKTIPITSTSNSVDVQFMPEGGTLIEDLPQKIAIKAINSAGHGEDVSGIIVDDSGNELTTFETSYLGMGNFIFNMQPGKTYTAKIKFKDGSTKDFRLPLAQKSGYAVAVNNLDTAKVSLKIMASNDIVNGEELKVVAQQGGNVYYVSKAKMDKQVLLANIPRKNLPAGIIQFTLFSATNQPIAERLIFNQNKQDLIDVALNNSGVSTNKRGKSTFTFDASSEQKPVVGSFSVSVTNASKVEPDEDNETNILTSLLLTSDIAGYVEKPNHYFLNDDVKTQKELDNLMLTQGWRRFNWKNIINSQNPNITYKPEESLSISGTVMKGNKPVVGGKVMLMATKGTVFILDTITNAEGKFVFDNLTFGDSTKFVVQARTKTERKFVDINLDVVPGQIVTKNKNGADVEINVNNALMKYIKESDNYFNEMTRLGLLERTIKLDEVTITEKKNPVKNSSNLNGAGHADYILKADDLSTCVTLSQCLQGRLPGVIFRGTTPYLMRSQNQPMSIVLDGMQVEADFLDNITPTDVETIELLKSIGNTAIYGSQGGGGVLVITTKRGGGDYSYNRYAPGILSFSPKGFSVSREFYAPKYDQTNNPNTADYRTTIYWNPQVVAGTDGKAKFEFYNANEPGNYRVVIEGIDAVGHLARKVYTYDVK
ncbi:carboxypeptidase-like regulatory domain-containing protein [Pedobacter punctiformis]|uniref:TonB-dependent receptor plug domain-containing protein n=1 Tax=Pedobacter punctiformis TaxID=3004097 RepID=A0ABT4L6C1_9SPHI|nr:TonB-dependent receptor plug domain-containing protein [Pedobacter sp. HCMS5-2]MCZ4243455.1 TonB-dependent receptor plug domain-containing protein [Pedobacter sp. HCMS5-2]